MLEVTAYRRAQRGAQGGRDCPLELVQLRKHLRGEDDLTVRVHRGEELLDLLLVRRVHERPQQRDSDRANVVALIPAGRLGEALTVEWGEHPAVPVHACDRLLHILKGNDTRRRVVEEPGSEGARHVDPCVLEQRPVALCEDETGWLEAPLQEAVRDDRRPVQDEVHVLERKPGCLDQRL